MNTLHPSSSVLTYANTSMKTVYSQLTLTTTYNIQPLSYGDVIDVSVDIVLMPSATLINRNKKALTGFRGVLIVFDNPVTCSVLVGASEVLDVLDVQSGYQYTYKPFDVKSLVSYIDAYLSTDTPVEVKYSKIDLLPTIIASTEESITQHVVTLMCYVLTAEKKAQVLPTISNWIFNPKNHGKTPDSCIKDVLLSSHSIPHTRTVPLSEFLQTSVGVRTLTACGEVAHKKKDGVEITPEILADIAESNGIASYDLNYMWIYTYK